MGKSLHTPRDIVRERSGGLCEKCGRVLTGNTGGVPDCDRARSIHHRQPRRHGGRDSVINLVNLCITCHKEIHDDEEAAALDGWIVIGRNPGNAPFRGHQGWVLPDTEGGLTPIDWGAGHLRLPAPARSTRRARVARRQRHRSSRVKVARAVA